MVSSKLVLKVVDYCEKNIDSLYDFIGKRSQSMTDQHLSTVLDRIDYLKDVKARAQHNRLELDRKYCESVLVGLIGENLDDKDLIIEIAELLK